MKRIINKIGFFRLVLTPIGIGIMVSAYNNHILGMGVIGLLITAFGLSNRCLLSGKCETDF
jgi:ABC-type enterobactin transport system permease subunit